MRSQDKSISINFKRLYPFLHTEYWKYIIYIKPANWLIYVSIFLWKNPVFTHLQVLAKLRIPEENHIRDQHHLVPGPQLFIIKKNTPRKLTWLNGKSPNLVGGWTNPFEKYARQNGNLPQIGLKIKYIWNHHPVIFIGDTSSFIVVVVHCHVSFPGV